MKKVLAVLLIAVMGLTVLAACGAYTLEQFVEEAKPQIQEISDSLGDEMSMEILARDGKFVYSFQYHIELDMSNEEAKAELDAQLKNAKDTYIDIVKEMEESGIKNSAVVVEYVDINGEVITSQEFK